MISTTPRLVVSSKTTLAIALEASTVTIHFSFAANVYVEFEYIPYAASVEVKVGHVDKVGVH